MQQIALPLCMVRGTRLSQAMGQQYATEVLIAILYTPGMSFNQLAHKITPGASTGRAVVLHLRTYKLVRVVYEPGPPGSKGAPGRGRASIYLTEAGDKLARFLDDFVAEEYPDPDPRLQRPPPPPAHGEAPATD